MQQKIMKCYYLSLLMLDSPSVLCKIDVHTVCQHVSVLSYLVEAELTPDRHRCSHCNSNVCVSHTLNLSGTRALHTPAREASEAAEGTDHSSGVERTGSDLGTHSPAGIKMQT